MEDETQPIILCVDDDPDILHLLTTVFETSYNVITTLKCAEGLKICLEQDLSIIIADQNMPEMQGIEFLVEANKLNPICKKMLMTGFGKNELIKNAINLGVVNVFLNKSADPIELKRVVDALLDDYTEDKSKIYTKSFNNISKNDRIVDETGNRFAEDENVSPIIYKKKNTSINTRLQFHNIISKSEKLLEIFDFIENLSEVNTTVLIIGESGTGKELIADALHYNGNRKEMPIVKVNCAALSDELLESELFGHVKGAFTGAINDRIGRFSKADGGTIFLDEIGDISNKMQLQLLRVLQENTFEKVGDSSSTKVNVRVIAATNQNLRQKVKHGSFREDLFYRLKVVELMVPPLRKRKEDIPLLTEHFLQMYNKKFNKNIESVSQDALNIFMNYSWPGNIRELQHTIEHAFVICRKPVIEVDNLPTDLKVPDKNREVYLEENEESDEREIIVNALKKTGWNRTKAAKLLQVDRKTIYLKVKKYNICEDEIN